MLNKLKGMTGQESEGSQEETEESDLSGSSIWASESHPTHSASSGEEDDVDSDTGVEGITSKSSSSSGFEIGSPVFVDVPNSSDEEAEQGDNGQSLRHSSASQKIQTRKRHRANRGYNHTYIDSEVQSLEIMTSESEQVEAKLNNASVSDVRNDSRAVFTEIPSPERPFLRPPSATAKELMEIHKNYRRGSHQENLDHSDPAKRPRYLPLAPPYHLLPNTSFFRKTAIKPPPTYCSDGLPPLKRIINRYLASILIDHMKSEEELRVFIQERKRQIRRENQGREGELKEHGETDGEGERTQAEDPSRDAHHRQKRKPRVVIQHLLYGGQLIHYIQDGCEPPSIPGYFTSAPLIPSNVRITRELNGCAPTEYQQLRTSQGIQFVPLGQSAEEMGTGEQPTAFPAEGSCRVAMSPRIESPSPSPPASEAEEVRECAAEAGSEFSVVTMERFASVSITSNVLNLKFAERRVSICRSPQQ